MSQPELPLHMGNLLWMVYNYSLGVMYLAVMSQPGLPLHMGNMMIDGFNDSEEVVYLTNIMSQPGLPSHMLMDVLALLTWSNVSNYHVTFRTTITITWRNESYYHGTATIITTQLTSDYYGYNTLREIKDYP